MKKLALFSFSLCLLGGLAHCGGNKKPVVVHEEKKTEQEKPVKRISGPLAEKEVGWTEEDFA